MHIKTNMLFIFRQLFVACTMMVFLFSASICLAGPSESTTGVLRYITPMTELNSHRRNVNASDYFDIVGILNSVDGNHIIIGDRQLTLAPSVGTGGMSQYNTVGANLNSDGQVVEIELISTQPN